MSQSQYSISPHLKNRHVHSPGKFTYAGLKSYLRLALYYTASLIHGTGCIALDGVFEDLATVRPPSLSV